MPITTVYRIDYEACALVFLLAITMRFFFARRFPTPHNRLFAIIMFCAVADIALDIIGSYTVMQIAVMPKWLNELVNTLFYGLQCLIPALLLA